MKNKNQILFLLFPIVFSCYGGNQLKSKKDDLSEIEKISKINELICKDTIERHFNRVAFKSKTFKRLNSEERFKLEECVTLKGILIDTSKDDVFSRKPGFDSTLRIDFMTSENNGEKYLTVIYPYFGWDIGCGNSVYISKYKIEQRNSKYIISKKVNEFE